MKTLLALVVTVASFSAFANNNTKSELEINLNKICAQDETSTKQEINACKAEVIEACSQETEDEEVILGCVVGIANS